MNKHLIPVASFLLALAGTASAAPNLSVTFVHPENYADAGYSRSYASEKERAELQRDIEQHLQTLAQRGLHPGETLKIEVLDIDLAGQFEPFRFRTGNDVRIVRDVAWPRMKLRYTLTQGDQVTASREEQISDMNFLTSINRYSSSDRLRYEKAMLDEWFDKRIVRRSSTPS
jgi:hypothetical protein